jgi:hypothetical protein
MITQPIAYIKTVHVSSQCRWRCNRGVTNTTHHTWIHDPRIAEMHAMVFITVRAKQQSDCVRQEGQLSVPAFMHA